jgi:hypothetical protein
MKKETLTFTIAPPKHRQHYVLFVHNTPFKQKVVQSKIAYKRQEKHKGKQDH